MSTPTTNLSGATTLTSRQRAGLQLSIVMNVINFAGNFIPLPADQAPPVPLVFFTAALSVLGIVAAVLALRSGSPVATRIVAGTLVINLLLTLPPLFVDLDAWIKITAGVSILLMVASLVMIFSSSARRAQHN